MYVGVYCITCSDPYQIAGLEKHKLAVGRLQTELKREHMICDRKYFEFVESTNMQKGAQEFKKYFGSVSYLSLDHRPCMSFGSFSIFMEDLFW